MSADPPPPHTVLAVAKESAAERRQRLAERVRTLPEEPGCYLMRDKKGVLFYVGKAANLRSRVRSYFSGSDTRQFVAWLDDLLADIDIILVRTEKEALLLERTLVREHQPRFNVKLRDDKNFIHLRLDLRPAPAGAPRRRRYPRAEVIRRPEQSSPGVRVFGPFHSATNARSTLRILSKHFQLRSCRDSVIDNRARPCLQHQIGRCPAPCVYDVDDYDERLNEAALFLGGRSAELRERLQGRMLVMSEQERFEEAARVRDQLASIAAVLDQQSVSDVDRRRNQDAYATARFGSRFIVVRIPVRAGYMQGKDEFDFATNDGIPTAELLSSFLSQWYGDLDAADIPDEVLLAATGTDDELSGADRAVLAEMLTERRGRKVEVRQPKRGTDAGVADIARINAEQAAADIVRKLQTRVDGMSSLQQLASLPVLPRVIECFDISLFQGTDAVASQVCFVDGAADKQRYRRMNIKTVDSTDDFAMMHEALTRRLKRGKLHGDLPDVLLIDGGKGQLNAALAACDDVGIVVLNRAGCFPDVAPVTPVAGVAVLSVAKARAFQKGQRPQTPVEAPMTDAGLQHSPERLFLPGVKDPIALRPHTASRFLIEQLRDEAHRFAITAHRQRRSQRTFRSVLEEISGVGKEKRLALMTRFGSAEGVAQASEAEIAAVTGIGSKLAARIVHALAPTSVAGHDEDEDDDQLDPPDSVILE
jgi:excinuclease ABC subunit C